MNTNINEIVTKVFDYLQKITNTNIVEKISSDYTTFKGSIGQYDIEKNLFNVYKEISNNNYDIAYINAISFLKELCQNVNVSDTSSKNLREIGDIFINSSIFIDEYERWYKNDFDEFVKELFKIPIIREDEKTQENAKLINKKIVNECNKIINETQLIKIHLYRNNNDIINNFDDVVFKDTIIITNSVNKIIASINESSDNNIHIYTIFKIEKIIDFSYFIFLIQYKNTIYLVTDANTFDNPRTKYTSRNPQRRREHVWDKVYLPYGIIDDIYEWRKENKTLMQGDNDIEFYAKKITEYLGFGDRCCIWFLLNSIVNKILEHPELPKISFVKEITTKLIEGKIDVDANNNSFIDVNTKECEEYVNDFIFPESTEIQKIEKSELIHKYIEDDWLCTFDNFCNLVNWSEKEEIRKTKQEVLNNYHNGHYQNGVLFYKKDTEKLKELISNNIDNILPIIFSGECVKVKIIGNSTSKCFGLHNNSQFIPTLVYHNGETSWANFGISGDRNGYKHINCKICNERNTSKQLYFNIHHYAELMLLCGLTNRKEIPQSFINYKAYHFIPYYGNSILDNVNPEFMLFDPVSKQFPNQYRICLHLCKICYNKYLKKYKKFNNSLVLININGEIQDIVDYNEYIKNNNENVITT